MRRVGAALENALPDLDALRLAFGERMSRLAALIGAEG
jgi:hypothetical protein